MSIWIDAQLPAALARWIRETFGIEAHAARDLGLLPISAGGCSQTRALSPEFASMRLLECGGADAALAA